MRRKRREQEVNVEVSNTINRLEDLTQRLEATADALERLIVVMKEEEASSQ